MLLTSRSVRAARPRKCRYVLADEPGMSLHVMSQSFEAVAVALSLHMTDSDALNAKAKNAATARKANATR
jgi:hypothetical protein